jgi:hypothetical protein
MLDSKGCDLDHDIILAFFQKRQEKLKSKYSKYITAINKSNVKYNEISIRFNLIFCVNPFPVVHVKVAHCYHHYSVYA